MRPYIKFCDLGHFRKYNDYKKKLRLLGNRAACGRANVFFIHKHKIVLQKIKHFGKLVSHLKINLERYP